MTDSQAQTIANDMTLMDTLMNLKSRWTDEREYETFADYISVASKYFEANFNWAEFKSMDKRFAIKFNVNGEAFKLIIKRSGQSAWFVVRILVSQRTTR